MALIQQEPATRSRKRTSARVGIEGVGDVKASPEKDNRAAPFLVDDDQLPQHSPRHSPLRAAPDALSPFSVGRASSTAWGEGEQNHAHSNSGAHNGVTAGGRASELYRDSDEEYSEASRCARREASYQAELLSLFRERGRLVCLLGVLLVPAFTLFYLYLAADVTRALLPVQAMQGIVLIAIYFLLSQVRTVQSARWLTLGGYVCFCMGAATVMSLAIYNQLGEDSAALRGLQFTILASYGQIMLTILLLPYSLWESLTVALLVIASLMWTLLVSVSTLNEPIYLSQIFILGSTMLLVMVIAHFQARLRRRVFDAAFDLAESAAQLQRLTITDALTEGYNRRYLELVLGGEIARAARFSHMLSIIMFDLDNFKRVNDTTGHHTGDEVLREIWRATARTVREVDTVARFGGDEFVIILPETSREAAASLATRLQQNARDFLVDRFGPSSAAAGVTLSIGLYTLRPSENVTVSYVLEQVDERLYQAKRQGKNQIAV